MTRDLLPAPGGGVCLVLLTGIGDVVHGLPLVNAIRAARPDLRIGWVAEPAPAQVLRHHPAVDQIILFDKRQGIGGLARLRSELRQKGRYDLAINAQRYFKGLFPTLLTGAPVRLGLSRDKTRDGVSFFNTHHLPSGPWKHTQDILLDFLPLMGLPRPDPLVWDIRFSEDEEQEAAAFFGRPDGRKRVGVVLGTAMVKKDWPTERYPDLADALAGRFDLDVYLLGGPSAKERTLVEQIRSSARHAPIDALATSVRQLMWRIRGMDFIISPDTGPVHIARALGVPVIGLYGHTSPARVGPYRAYQDLLIDRYTEPGEMSNPADYDPKLGRMELIAVEDVVEKVGGLVNRSGPRVES